MQDLDCRGARMEEFELACGGLIVPGRERVVPEMLFQPTVAGGGGECKRGDDDPPPVLSFPAAVHGCVTMACNDREQRDHALLQELVGNVVVCGGNTLFDGFQTRLQNELEALFPLGPVARQEVRVVASPERKYAVWIGGAMFASLPSFSNLCISRDEWENHEDLPALMDKMQHKPAE